MNFVKKFIERGLSLFALTKYVCESFVGDVASLSGFGFSCAGMYPK